MPLRTILITIALLILTSVSCVEKIDTPGGFYATPVFTGKADLTVDDDALRPVRLKLYHDTLFVSYKGFTRIDLFDTILVKVASV